MRLYDLFSHAALTASIKDGLVRINYHPDDMDLAILNYTEAAQYGKVWTDVTLNCRGLIVRLDTHEIVARPFPKFFNYGEMDGLLDLEASVEVTDKLDGSLGILYPHPDGRQAIATRGSFTSEQALHATEVWRERYEAEFRGPKRWTHLFEIVYPQNRIVVDYGEMDDLIALGAIDPANGQCVGPASVGQFYHGPVAETFGMLTLREALAMEPRPNSEGLVVRFLENDVRVKIKQEDYVRLHKLVTGLNERAVWEHLSQNGGRYHDLLASVPDEFHTWVDTVAGDLLEHHEVLSGRAHAAYYEIVDRMADEDWADRVYRKVFAEKARDFDMPGLLFSLLDGKDISPSIWKSLRPVGEKPFQRDYSESELMAA